MKEQLSKVTSSAFAGSKINILLSENDKHISYTKVENEYEIIDKSIMLFSSIPNSRIRYFLYEMNNTVFFNIKALENLGFHKDALNLLEQKHFKNTTFDTLEKVGFFRDDISKDIYISETNTLLVGSKGPKFWWEWLTFSWSLFLSYRYVNALYSNKHKDKLTENLNILHEVIAQIPGFGIQKEFVIKVIDNLMKVKKAKIKWFNTNRGVMIKFRKTNIKNINRSRINLKKYK
ncbi:hypothetical protein SCHIN_v1c07470 [Spiroplasma chinense]|uniref:Uncharacterized protein n=1 Tax=Spiroplasma chinense TaxID=216932 RepID=A0A5B9Y764_9MOLU|nr:hypothetical protein [Spiroplasma chinense]QEH61942.1 hypothetical protein SCHIN_v1c07470 [Spiroplasma chinense]